MPREQLRGRSGGDREPAARYLFAMDFHDPDLYVTTFTEDGILDVGSGEIKGRKAIHDTVAKMPNPGAGPVPEGLWPAVGRHNILNIVLEIDENTATGRAYWFHTPTTIPSAAPCSMGSVTTR